MAAQRLADMRLREFLAGGDRVQRGCTLPQVEQRRRGDWQRPSPPLTRSKSINEP